MGFASLVLWVCAAQVGSPRAEAPGVRCATSCRRAVSDRSLRTRICGHCALEGASDRAVWVSWLAAEGREAELNAALADPDWRVKRAALKGKALLRHTDEDTELALFLATAPAPKRAESVVAAIHIAGARGLSRPALEGALRRAGTVGARAREGLALGQRAAREAIAVDLYSESRSAALEALAHLAVFEGRTPTQVALAAMESRPPATDPIIAEALRAASANQQQPVGRALLEAAPRADKALVDRLLAVYAADLDQLRARVPTSSGADRQQLAEALASYAPLSDPELEGLTGDEDPRVRTLAARGLTSGRGQTLVEGVQGGVAAPDAGADDERVLRWVRILGDSGDRECEAALLKLGGQAALSPRVRGAAYAALGPCAGERALPVIAAQLSSPLPEVRAGAVSALRAMPRTGVAEEAAARALDDPDPKVLAEAIAVVGGQLQRGQAVRIADALGHPVLPVRLAAARALAVLGDRRVDKQLAAQLAVETDRDVRAALVRALREVGGPVAAAALSRAAHDPDGRVRYLAQESLRALGFQQ